MSDPQAATPEPRPEPHPKPHPEPRPDPRPEPPLPPDEDACCGSGCTPCVYDLYDAALERHRAALRAWQERHPDAPRAAARPTLHPTLDSAGPQARTPSEEEVP